MFFIKQLKRTLAYITITMAFACSRTKLLKQFYLLMMSN